MIENDDLKKEGHTREWQDRARVVVDAKKAAHTDASPKQSPESKEDIEDVEEKSDQIGRTNSEKDDSAY